jgi:TLD/Rab-GTPase-TBC domain
LTKNLYLLCEFVADLTYRKLLPRQMVRKGIPPHLRCAVWLSNIVQATQQDPKAAREYRTLSKVRILDHVYDTVWENTVKERDICRVDFGNDQIWNRCGTMPGAASLEKVLYALSSILQNIETAPLIPTITAILLGSMSESYAFYASRQILNNPTWYLAISQSEHTAYGQAFLAILGKLHPNTLETLKEKGFEDKYTTSLFSHFLVDLLPEKCVLRLFDIYTLEGTKCLFRFGVAIAVLYQREWKERYIYELETSWWDGLVQFCAIDVEPQWEVLVKKAYGVHGRGIRQRFRFPRRPILTRIIQLEEDAHWVRTMEESTDFLYQKMDVKPLGLVTSKPSLDPDREPEVPKLAESTLVRTKLAEWLPLSLRFTKMELIFSTNHHGRTLENLYRSVAKARRTIMLIEPLSTRREMVIGMFASQTWQPSSRVYGDGSCFLFRVVDGEPSMTNCWKWHSKELKSLMSDDGDDEGSIAVNEKNATALLEQFQVSTHAYLSMGGNPNGTAGLRLNEDLTKGESSPASGFDNEPLAGDMFEVGMVEVYQLVREMDGRPVY